MPLWLQNIAKFLPLTPVIEGLRDIISQGKTIFDLGPELLLMGVWIIIIYFVAFKVFKWE
jgi:ABC-2 type transport system permease protein